MISFTFYLIWNTDTVFSFPFSRLQSYIWVTCINFLSSMSALLLYQGRAVEISIPSIICQSPTLFWISNQCFLSHIITNTKWLSVSFRTLPNYFEMRPSFQFCLQYTCADLYSNSIIWFSNHLVHLPFYLRAQEQQFLYILYSFFHRTEEKFQCNTCTHVIFQPKVLLITKAISVWSLDFTSLFLIYTMAITAKSVPQKQIIPTLQTCPTYL